MKAKKTYSWLGRSGLGILCALLLLGATGCDDSHAEIRVSSGTYASPSYYNLYSGEVRFLVVDRFGGYPLSGARVETHWVGPSGAVWHTTTYTDRYGFARTAVAPVNLYAEPYHSFTIVVHHPGYTVAYVEERIHWRLIGPYGSGGSEWRFDNELSIRLRL